MLCVKVLVEATEREIVCPRCGGTIVRVDFYACPWEAVATCARSGCYKHWALNFPEAKLSEVVTQIQSRAYLGASLLQSMLERRAASTAETAAAEPAAAEAAPAVHEAIA